MHPIYFSLSLTNKQDKFTRGTETVWFADWSGGRGWCYRGFVLTFSEFTKTNEHFRWYIFFSQAYQVWNEYMHLCNQLCCGHLLNDFDIDDKAWMIVNVIELIFEQWILWSQFKKKKSTFLLCINKVKICFHKIWSYRLPEIESFLSLIGEFG